jgi:hypothetical protein
MQWNAIGTVVPEFVNPIIALVNLLSPIIQTCVRNPKHYFNLLMVQLFFSVPSGLFVIITTFMQKKQDVEMSCTSGAMSNSIMEACQHTRWFQGIVIAFIVAGWAVLVFQLVTIDFNAQPAAQPSQDIELGKYNAGNGDQFHWPTILFPQAQPHLNPLHTSTTNTSYTPSHQSSPFVHSFPQPEHHI